MGSMEEVYKKLLIKLDPEDVKNVQDMDDGTTEISITNRLRCHLTA